MIKNGVTTSKERASYYSYFFGQNMLYFIVVQFAMLYYTDYVGISATVIATIFLVARIWDAAMDPLFGIIVDKAHLKGGKFKPWVNLAAIILPIMTILVFITPNISPTGRIIYVSITYLLWGMAYTLSDVPNFALSTVMSNNLNERNSLLANGRLFVIIAILIVSIVIIPGTKAIGWETTAIIIGIVACILMNFSRFNVKERYAVENENITIGKIFSYVAHNKYLLIYYLGLTILFAFNTGQVAMNYFAIYNMGSAALIPLLTMIMVIPMVIAAMILPRIIAKFGKIKITIYALALNTIVSILYFFVGYNNFALVCVFTAVTGLLTSVHTIMFPMFTADCIEYATWKTGGERAAGISFAIQTFTTKLGQALNAGLAGYILAFIKYVPNKEQSAKSLTGIFSMMTLIPALGAVLMLIIFGLFYKLKESDVERMMREVEERSTKVINN